MPKYILQFSEICDNEDINLFETGITYFWVEASNKTEAEIKGKLCEGFETHSRQWITKLQAVWPVKNDNHHASDLEITLNQGVATVEWIRDNLGNMCGLKVIQNLPPTSSKVIFSQKLDEHQQLVRTDM